MMPSRRMLTTLLFGMLGCSTESPPVAHVSIRNLVDIAIAHDTFFFIGKCAGADFPKVTHTDYTSFTLSFTKAIRRPEMIMAAPPRTMA